MKYLLKALIGIMFAAAAGGCAQDMQTISRTGLADGPGSCRNTPETAPGSVAYADVHLSASLKTHKPGIYLMNDKCHGTESFKLIVHIDGRPLPMNGTLHEEDGSHIGEQHPEAGSGIRYDFTGSIRLKAGRHAITVSVPEDDIYEQSDIHLKEGSNRILIEPVYKKRKPYRKIGFAGDTSFYEGIKGFKVIVNGSAR